MEALEIYNQVVEHISDLIYRDVQNFVVCQEELTM